jgi:hypothetical protein
MPQFTSWNTAIFNGALGLPNVVLGAVLESRSSLADSGVVGGCAVGEEEFEVHEVKAVISNRVVKDLVNIGFCLLKRD